MVIRSTSGCSGASTMYVAPKMVSGRVVKTLMVAFSPPESRTTESRILNPTSAPSLRPIQFSCALRVLSDQSIQERLSSRRSA